MGTGYVDSLLVSRRSADTLCGTNTTDNADLDPQTDPQEQGNDFAILVISCIVDGFFKGILRPNREHVQMRSVVQTVVKVLLRLCVSLYLHVPLPVR